MVGKKLELQGAIARAEAPSRWEASQCIESIVRLIALAN
jgi:hypothetical protein